MNLKQTLYRIATAPLRHHRAKGHGIHSPYAYRFVRQVLSEKAQYYAYGIIRNLASGRNTQRHLRLLLRLANHFEATQCLCYGPNVETELAAILLANRAMKAIVVNPKYTKEHSRIIYRKDIISALKEYRPEGNFFILLTARPADIDSLTQFVTAHSQGVIVISGTDRPEQAGLADELWGMVLHGQHYTNLRTSIIVLNPKLQAEYFTLHF